MGDLELNLLLISVDIFSVTYIESEMCSWLYGILLTVQ